MSELSDDDIKNIRRDGNRGWFHFTLSDKDIKLLDKWHENARSGNNFTYIDESKPDPYADEESWLIPGLTQDASTGALGALPTKEWLSAGRLKTCNYTMRTVIRQITRARISIFYAIAAT